VTVIGIQFYSLAATVFQSVQISLKGYRMIRVAPPPSSDANYTFALDRNLNGQTIDQVVPGFRSILQIVIAPLDASRVGMFFIDDTFVLHFDSPEYVTVRWTGNYDATTGFEALKLAIYQILSLDPDNAANHNLFDPEYNATTREIIIYFFEDMTKPSDTSYLTRSCTFAQDLFIPSNRALIESLNFNIEGMWRMPETIPATCPLIAPPSPQPSAAPTPSPESDVLKNLRGNDGAIKPLFLGLIIGGVILLVIIIVVIIVIGAMRKKGWKKAPTVV